MNSTNNTTSFYDNRLQSTSTSLEIRTFLIILEIGMIILIFLSCYLIYKIRLLTNKCSNLFNLIRFYQYVAKPNPQINHQDFIDENEEYTTDEIHQMTTAAAPSLQTSTSSTTIYKSFITQEQQQQQQFQHLTGYTDQMDSSYKFKYKTKEFKKQMQRSKSWDSNNSNNKVKFTTFNTKYQTENERF